MSKEKAKEPPSDEDKDTEEDRYRSEVERSCPPHTHYTYHYDEPGPSHRMYSPESELYAPMGEPIGVHGLLPTPTLRTRGPGRPRIHPPKPAGVSRPRGRPKGSKNKKPRKKIERPPKRPRGRPRKWPPEMWEGFQRTREAAVQQQLKQQHQQHQQILHHPQQEMPGPSHMYMDQPGEIALGMAQIPGLPPHHMSAPPPPHTVHHHHQQHHPSHIPHYMQMPLETEQPQDLALMMPHQRVISSQEQMQPRTQMVHPMLLPSVEGHVQGHITEQEEFIWMQQMPPGDHPPPHSTS